MKDRSFAIFIMLLLIVHPLVLLFSISQWISKGDGSSKFRRCTDTWSSLGNLLPLLVPWFFRQLGIKKMLLIGMGFKVLRYVLFAEASFRKHLFLYLGVLFHGICYDFFFVTGQLYVDKVAPDDIRSSAQGFIAFVTLGVGCLLGEFLMVGGMANRLSMDPWTGLAYGISQQRWPL